MKIVSKFKDFYDYLAQDFDADIVYVREAKYQGKIDDIAYKYYKSYSNRVYRDETKIIQFNHTYPAHLGNLYLNLFIYGIYPFIYSVPTLLIYGRKDYSWESYQPIIEFLTRSFIESLKGLDKEKTNEVFNELAVNCIKTFNKKNKDTFPFNPYEESIEYKLDTRVENIYEDITKRCKKLECPDVFNLLQAPVFIEEDEFLDFYHAGYSLERDEIYKKQRSNYDQYVINPSLTVINPQIIKYWYDDLVNINTYNDIENFLWSIKQEPISEPTNKQKIVNHGFDLKTSFRKM